MDDIQIRPRVPNDVYMWDELCDSADLCRQRCELRSPCIAFEWTSNGECHMYRDSGYTYPKISPEAAPEYVDCAICDCPESTRVRNPKTRQETCTLLNDKTIRFAGDSLVRDQWTTLGVWLSSLEMDIFDARHVEHHAACMINAWKFLHYLDIESRLKQRGLYSDVGERGISEFNVCSGKTKIQFVGLNTFDAIQNYFDESDKLSSIDLLIVGGGIHQMVTYGNDERRLLKFMTWLDNKAEEKTGKTKVIYVGTHHRIIERAPTPYREYAEGPQGNTKIQRWNSLFCHGLNIAVCVDPYWITESLTHSYADTEDGMHMGAWVNLQKVQLILTVV